MFGDPLFEAIRMAGVVTAIDAFQDICPETHNPLALSPFALSLSKGVPQVRSCFDKPVLSQVEGLSTNGWLIGASLK